MNEPTPSLAECMLQMSDNLAPIQESVLGYRSKMEEAGFSASQAAEMAVDYHRFLLAAITGATTSKTNDKPKRGRR